MTLKECLEKNNLCLHPECDGTLVIDGALCSDIWDLSDYKVSSVSCGNTWMVPVKTDTKEEDRGCQ